MSLSPLVSFKSRFVTYLLNFPRSIQQSNSQWKLHFCVFNVWICLFNKLIF